MKRVFFIVIAVFFLLEIYVFQALKTLTANPIIKSVYIGITLLLYIFTAYEVFRFDRSERDQHTVQIVVTIFVAFLIPKIFIVLFLLLEDIFRLLYFAFEKITHKEFAHFPERRKFLNAVGFGIAGFFSLLVLDGVFFGKYRHKVRRLKLKINNLPENFRGYKIVQISDVHSGSFFHPDKLKPAVDLINQQNADLVLFTGDMVNNYAAEFEPFVPLFSTIRAKDAKMAVLGNHDYGEYVQWNTEDEHQRNIPNLIKLEKMAGFDVLRNEHRIIERNGEKLYILGVENWGEKPFPQIGDLTKAAAGVPPEAAKILMSHDPTHFDHHVKKHPANVQLTLSGHTHGMQFGLDLKNARWSPVQYRYKKWADLYESEGKYLYVNRGFGVIGYPGRVGILPEITLIELV